MFQGILWDEKNMKQLMGSCDSSCAGWLTYSIEPPGSAGSHPSDLNFRPGPCFNTMVECRWLAGCGQHLYVASVDLHLV